MIKSEPAPAADAGVARPQPTRSTLMKRLNFIVIILLLSVAFPLCYGQTTYDSLLIVKTKRTIYVKQNGKSLSFRKLYKITETDPEAFIEIKRARKLKVTVGVMSWTSGILCGLSFQGLAKGHYENAIPVGASLIYMLGTIPLTKDKLNHMEKAVQIYNRSLKRKVAANSGEIPPGG